MPLDDIHERLASCTGFDWDEHNSLKIWDKHRVASNECEEVFFRQPLLTVGADLHLTGEERFYALGETEAERRLFIVFTLRGEKIRVISARPMSRKERRVYESQ